MKTKSFFIIAMAAVGLFAAMSLTGFAPGSDQWHIRVAAARYVRNEGLQDGEKLRYVGLVSHKEHRVWNGQECKYATVKYTVRNASGQREQRILHLLMTERCDSMVEVSRDGEAEWIYKNDAYLLKGFFLNRSF